MAENKLPSGVGKKIVAALKKQSETNVQTVSDAIENEPSLIKNAVEAVDSNGYEEPVAITDNVQLPDDMSDFAVEEKEAVFDPFETEAPSIADSFDNELDTAFDNLGFDELSTNSFEEKEIFQTSTHSNPQMQQKTYAVPANVAVLKRLIMQLPEGVSKQTGAQIIRQTMEALGISMKSVLKEAQQGQESITTSAKACLATIAEYKNNIRGLEKQVQDYKKQAMALNDLISLFVMTDK